MPPSPKPLFADAHERKTMVVAAAAVAMHAMISARPTISAADGPNLIADAFVMGGMFVSEAERRLNTP